MIDKFFSLSSTAVETVTIFKLQNFFYLSTFSQQNTLFHRHIKSLQQTKKVLYEQVNEWKFVFLESESNSSVNQINVKKTFLKKTLKPLSCEIPKTTWTSATVQN